MMEKSMELQVALDELNNIPQFMSGTGVERMSRLLIAMGNPEKDLKIIHVAGTNGKGSVCAYMDSILRQQGYRVGMFTSPHLQDVRERIRIDGELISEREFLEGYMHIKEIQRVEGLELAYFDYMLGIALMIYKKTGVDFCIIETGLGGRLDDTNAICGKLLNVITGISLEHTALLGDTVEQIAAEKAGIIDRGEPVVYMDKDERAARVIEERAHNVSSEAVPIFAKGLRIIKNTGKSIDFSVHNGYYKNDCFTISTAAVYQVENCGVALTAIGYLNAIGVLDISYDVISRAVTQTHWAGRMEEVAQRVYVDGAHNPEGIQALVKSVKAIAGKDKAWLLFSVVSDKDYDAMIKTICLSEVFEGYVVTEVYGNRKLDVARIKAVFEKYTDKEVNIFYELKDAYEYVRSQCLRDDAYCFCTGSLYLVGDIKALSE